MRLDMYEMSENRILIGEYQMANKRKLIKKNENAADFKKVNSGCLPIRAHRSTW